MIRFLFLLLSMSLTFNAFASTEADFLEIFGKKRVRIFSSQEDYTNNLPSHYFEDGFIKMTLNEKLSGANKIFEVGGANKKSVKLGYDEVWAVAYTDEGQNDSIFSDKLLVFKTYATYDGFLKYNLFRPTFKKNNFIVYLAPGQDILKNKAGKSYYTDATKQHRNVFYNFDLESDTIQTIGNYQEFNTLLRANKDVAYALPYIDNYIYGLKKEGKLTTPINISDIENAFIEDLKFHPLFNTTADIKKLDAAHQAQLQNQQTKELEEAEKLAKEKLAAEEQKSLNKIEAEKAKVKAKEAADKLKDEEKLAKEKAKEEKEKAKNSEKEYEY